MAGIRPYTRFAVLAVLVFPLLSGCASVCRTGPAGPLPFERETEKATAGWWYAQFQIRWPPGEEPCWYVDTMIAHRIVAPVLSRYGKKITLWRFHRRAGRDEAGHQFSFIFHSTPATARKVYGAIESNGLLKEMKTAGLIVRDTREDTGRITRPGYGDTSDPAWSKPLRTAWPYFIMGASRTWLDLIEQFAGDGREKPSGFDDMESFYRGIDQSVRETWEKEGAHAFLHHLNAVFGYEPLIVYRKHQMRF